jgi:hypothetical protein
MSKSILIGACGTAFLSLCACNYNEDYNNQAYNAEGTSYEAPAGEYDNTTDYNATNQAYEGNDMAGNAAANVGNAVVNNSY